MKDVSQRLRGFMEQTNYPHMPLQGVSRDFILDFFTKLQKDIGEDVLLIFQSPVLPINEDPEHLADVFLRMYHCLLSGTSIQSKIWRANTFRENLLSKRYSISLMVQHTL